MSESHDLQSAILAELENLRKELDAVEPLLKKLQIQDPDQIEIRAVATTLHAFYTGVERIFVQIAKHVDEDLPGGSSWHQELLRRMASPSSLRPAVIDDALSKRLTEYLGFRHFYRHAYPLTLKWKRIQPLVQGLEQTYREIESTVRRFLSSHFSSQADHLR